MAHYRVPQLPAIPLTFIAQPRPNFPSQGYLSNGASSGPTPGAAALLPNNGRVIQQGGIRVLCVADVRGTARPGLCCAFQLLITIRTGNLKSLNDLAKQARADHIIHTGDFGFYDDSSLERIADKLVSCHQNS